jgi:hypothetical protein
VLKIKTKTLNNNYKKVLYLQSLLQDVKKGSPQQKQQKNFKIDVVNKYAGYRSEFEIYSNGQNLTWRVITEVGSSLWRSWTTEKEIFDTFCRMGLLS